LQRTLAAEELHTTFHHCDLRDMEATKAVFGQITEAEGPIRVLVNNAGRDDRHDVAAVTPSDWENCMAVNLRHQFFCAQLAAASMQTASQGVILNMGSASWHVAVPNLSIYMTAKAGIRILHAAWRVILNAMASGSTASFPARCVPRGRCNSGKPGE
jgi:NAD(P)-dependent dehydrogenase (short-subunit alcohol dehydrogenase family)